MIVWYFSYLYGYAKKILALAVKNIRALLCIFYSLIRIFMVNHEDTCARCEKYSSKLDISRSFICIFATRTL